MTNACHGCVLPLGGTADGRVVARLMGMGIEEEKRCGSARPSSPLISQQLQAGQWRSVDTYGAHCILIGTGVGAGAGGPPMAPLTLACGWNRAAGTSTPT